MGVSAKMKKYTIIIREFPDKKKDERYSIQMDGMLTGWWSRSIIVKKINEYLKRKSREDK